MGSSCPCWTEAAHHLNPSIASSQCRYPSTAATSPAPGISPMFSLCSLGIHQGSERTKQYRLPRPAGALVSVGVGAAFGVQSLPACVMVQLLAQMQTHPKTLGVCQTYLLFVCKTGRAEGPPNTAQSWWVASPVYSPAKPGQNGWRGPHSGLPLCVLLSSLSTCLLHPISVHLPVFSWPQCTLGPLGLFLSQNRLPPPALELCRCVRA